MRSPEIVRSVLESAPDAMLIVDATGRILFAYHQVSALFGYGHDEIIDQRVESLMPERFRSRHLAHRERYTASGLVRPMGMGLDLFALRKDGTEFPVEISLSPIGDGDSVLVAAAIRDVGDRKRVEAKLKSARDAADRANQAKSRFLATASHDLRQPLQTLALLNGSLHRMVHEPEVREALSQQDQAIGAMSRLLNALLDISKLESGAIRPEITDFSVSLLFEELRREFAGLAAAKGLQLTIEPCMERVHTDASLVGQVLRNLVSNAIKYTQTGWVALRCLHEQAFVRIEVLDTGIGIRADELAHIYDEFYQVGVPANTSRDGYGLGLSIVQRVVKLLNLRLDVQSEPDKGSRFSLELPVSEIPDSRIAPAAIPSRADPEEEVSLPHVLLVEDDAAVRSAARMLMKVAGYRVSAVSSLGEALRQAHDQRDIDLIVTDYYLEGGETGMQVISSVRAVLGPGLKAVLITGDTSSAIQGLRRDDNLRVASKPVDAEEFLALLNDLLAT